MTFSGLRWKTMSQATLIAALFLPEIARADAGKEPVSPAGVGVVAANSESDRVDSHVVRLIRQLGDPDYFVRQAAQEELSRLGQIAFDALSAAESDDDIEVSSRAKYLVQLIRIELVSDSDSPKIKQLLQNYELGDESERWLKLQKLAAIPGNAGLVPLCRMVRFEKSPRLSKQAALLIMGQPNTPSSDWTVRAEAIAGNLAASTRPGARWLRAYLQSRNDLAAAVADWEKLIDEEQASLENAPVNSLSEVMPTLESQVVKLLVQRQAWEKLDDVARHIERQIGGNRFMLYLLAEARRTQGKVELAEVLAKQAFQVQADDVGQHWLVAHDLKRRGLFDWSEREFRHVIASPNAQLMMQARYALAEMLHDLERDSSAAEVLQALVNAMKRNPAVMQRVEMSADSLLSRTHYFQACHYAQLQQRNKQLQQLDEAIIHDPDDADVLIALYQTATDDPVRRKRALELIQKAAERFRTNIIQGPGESAFYNQYAWLIGNTEGDFTLAIHYSQKSLELRPDEAGYLDTLAHCYAGARDYENAVKHQTRAVELEPHTQQITRALKRFQAQLEKSRAETP